MSDLAGLVSYASFFLIFALINGIAVLGLNLQWGQTGLFNVGVAAFVIVAAALEQRDAPALDCADDEPPGVAFDARHRETLELRIGQRDRIGGLLGERAEAGAQHDPERRQAFQAVLFESDNRAADVLIHEGCSSVRRLVQRSSLRPDGDPQAFAVPGQDLLRQLVTPTRCATLVR